jgi:hypothetical protein
MEIHLPAVQEIAVGIYATSALRSAARSFASNHATRPTNLIAKWSVDKHQHQLSLKRGAGLGSPQLYEPQQHVSEVASEGPVEMGTRRRPPAREQVAQVSLSL